MSNIKIYHNPRCSKSRQTLAIIEQQGFTPEIIKYLENPPSTDEITSLLDMLNMQPRELMRKGESEYKENNMKDTALSNDDLVDLMHLFPKVIERPIVIANKKAVIGRPPEAVLDII